jgi:hypothetical protein
MRAERGSRRGQGSAPPAASRRSASRPPARRTGPSCPPRSRPRAPSRRSTRPRDSRPARRSRLRRGSTESGRAPRGQTYPRATSNRRRSRALPGGRLTPERGTSDLLDQPPAPETREASHQSQGGSPRGNRGFPRALDRLELLEGLPATLAVADRAARGRAEDVFEPRFRRAAIRALERLALQLDELRPARFARRRRRET